MLLIEGLHKHYRSKNGEDHHALKGINLSFDEKGFVFILGKSGSGKSTLLNILGGLDNYDEGQIIINERLTEQFTRHDWDSYRNTYVGFIFQDFYMVDSFTIGKNIAIPLELQGYPKEDIKRHVDEILKQVGLEGYANRKTSEISGGQKQRIAIARALVKDPQIIIADEPTGNLDSETGESILEILKELSKEKLVIMVTHDAEFAKTYGDRIIELKDGQVISDGLSNDQDNLIYNNIDDNIQSYIPIPNGSKLDQQLIDYLQNIDQQNRDTYIIMTTQPKMISSAVLNINTTKHDKETKKIQQSDLLNNSNNRLELKQSKLLSRNAFKLAIRNILLKKFRFAFITFLFVIALVFVGVGTMFSFFDFASVTHSTITNGDTKYMGASKQTEYCDEERCEMIPTTIKQSDIDELLEPYPSINYTTSNLKDVYFTPVMRSEMGFYSNTFNKVTIIDDHEMFPLWKGRYPTEVGEILISDYVARVMQVFFVFGFRINYDEILGKTISDGNNTYTIVGFVDTDYEKFNHIVNSRVMEHFERENFYPTRDTHYRHLYMSQETYDLSYKKVSSPAIIEIKNESAYRLNLILPHPKYSTLLLGDSRLPESQNEIVLTASSAYDFLSKEFDSFDPNDEELLSLIGEKFDIKFGAIPNNQKDWSKEDLPTRNYTIVGIYDDITDGNYSSYWLGTKEEAEEIEQLLPPDYSTQLPNMVYLQLGDNSNENERFIHQLINEGWTIETEFTDDLYEVNDTIKKLEVVFYIIGGFVASFTGLMIYLFISTSIQRKQKEIGILRAIGARGIDVSKIYMFEGLIMGLVACLFANTLFIIVIKLMNYYVDTQVNYNITLFSVNYLNIIIIVIFTLLVVMMSSFLPIRKITMMKPINAIKRSND